MGITGQYCVTFDSKISPWSCFVLLSDRFPEYGHLSLYVLSQKMLTDRAPMNLLDVIILFDFIN